MTAAEVAVLESIVRDLAPRRIGGLTKAGHHQAYTAHPFLNAEQWAAIDRAVEAAS